MGVIPNFNIGFTVFTAPDPDADPEGDLLHGNAIPDILLNTILPPIDRIAKRQAAEKFAGTYTSQETNSTLSVETDDINTGLLVKQWISNGADLLGFFNELSPDIVFRIIPNQMLSGNKVGFTSFYSSPQTPPVNNSWYWNCPTWVDVDELTFGNIPLGQMAFNVGEDGKAESVELVAMRATLTKQG
jgi:hypothetical protein